MEVSKKGRNEEIWENRKNGMTYNQLAEKYSVSISTIDRICKRNKALEKKMKKEPENSILRSSLSKRTANVLYKAGILTTDELLTRINTENGLNNIAGLGAAGIKECVNYIGCAYKGEKKHGQDIQATQWELSASRDNYKTSMFITAQNVKHYGPAAVRADNIIIQFEDNINLNITRIEKDDDIT